MSSKNREIQLARQRASYNKRKDYFKAKRKERHEALRRWWDEEIVPTMKCNRCPENDKACIDFHHSDPATKEFKISTMIKGLKNKEIILAEIAKCEMLCANCHRKHHYYEEKSEQLNW